MTFSKKSSFKPYLAGNPTISFQPFFPQIIQNYQTTNFQAYLQLHQNHQITFVNMNNFLQFEDNYLIFTKNNIFSNQSEIDKKQFQLMQILIQSQINNNLLPQKQQFYKQQQQQQQQQEKQKQEQVQFNLISKQKQKTEHTYRNPHLKRPFICHICGKGLTSQTILNHHISEKHGDKKWKCPTCTYVAASKLRLMRHSCKVQGQQCPLCKKRNIDMNKHNYNIHKPQTCLTCGQQFIGYNQLRKHDLQKHRIEKSSKKIKVNDKY